MWQDLIVEEGRAVRARHAEKFQFDVWAIYQDLKQQEQAGQRPVVTLPPKKRRRMKSVIKARLPHQVAQRVTG